MVFKFLNLKNKLFASLFLLSLSSNSIYAKEKIELNNSIYDFSNSTENLVFEDKGEISDKNQNFLIASSLNDKTKETKDFIDQLYEQLIIEKELNKKLYKKIGHLYEELEYTENRLKSTTRQKAHAKDEIAFEENAKNALLKKVAHLYEQLNEAENPYGLRPYKK